MGFTEVYKGMGDRNLELCQYCACLNTISTAHPSRYANTHTVLKAAAFGMKNELSGCNSFNSELWENFKFLHETQQQLLKKFLKDHCKNVSTGASVTAYK